MAGDEFREKSLGEVAEFRNGKAIAPEKYSERGNHPVFGSNGQIARSDEVLNPDPVVVIGRVGANCGSVHYVPEASWVTDNAIIALPKHGNHLRFLYYLLGHLDLRRTAIGSAQPLMTQGGLRVVRSLFPAPKTQQAIASILGALDDKIELNRRTHRTLEAMARAIFKSWFVDFDPVRAKAAGQQPPGLKPDVAGLFPDAFDNSGLGKIPMGWNVHRWGDIATLEYGKSLRGYEGVSDGFRVYGTNGPIGWHKTALCTSAGIIIGRKGAYRGIHYSTSPFYVIDTAFYLNPKQELDLKWAYYELIRLDINSMDSGSAIPSTSREDFYALSVCVPSVRVLRRFGELLGPLAERQENLERENAALIALRDALLPKLISGEVRVPDAERVLAEAGR